MFFLDRMTKEEEDLLGIMMKEREERKRIKTPSLLSKLKKKSMP
jgi:hypothetical protein